MLGMIKHLSLRDEHYWFRSIVAVTPLDAPPRQKDPTWQEWGIDFPDMRDIILHVIAETACHAGHLDAARELVDGHQFLVM